MNQQMIYIPGDDAKLPTLHFMSKHSANLLVS
jgi:hypothetical protein